MRYLLIILTFAFLGNLQAQEEIQWMDIESAQKALEKKPKKIIMDVYTNWCGWCKRMDAGTFKHPEIVKYINEHYYAVKFNAETRDSVTFKGKTYVNRNGNVRRPMHDLATIAAVNQRVSYPTIVYMDEDLNLLSPVPGYVDAKGIEPILHYFAEEAYKETPWQEYQSSFVGKVK